MLKLDANALQVESFPAAEATDYDVIGVRSTPGPMCTCVSCTMGFPECDDTSTCATQDAGTAAGA
jgi:hypothetical protein